MSIHVQILKHTLYNSAWSSLLLHIQKSPQSHSNYLLAWESLECLALASQSTEPSQLSQSPWLQKTNAKFYCGLSTVLNGFLFKLYCGFYSCLPSRVPPV